ncbi:MAG: sigma-70 family RNA polymerase sigma factor [Planctomycetota bacterium]|nr:sigma-70 family RNA polymerase sigma factor [Planctomycetota bacterium]MDA1163870.1 sigma-70 family RNA polymerase sigma factor [Planctomycetota bacterium]
MTKQTENILELLRNDGPRIHRLLTRLTLREDVAADLMQDLFLKLRNSDGFIAAEDATAYAVRTATNLAFEWRRKRGRRRTHTMDIEPLSALPSPLASLEKKEQYELILEALDQLSDLSRNVIVLSRLEGNSYESVAKQLGKTPHQVRALVSKAVAQLKSQLGISSSPPKGAEI